MAMVNADSLSAFSGEPEVQVGRLGSGSKVSGRRALYCIHQMNRVNSGPPENRRPPQTTAGLSNITAGRSFGQ